MVIFDTAYAFPLNSSSAAPTLDALAPSLLSFRCELAASTGVALSLVRITAGVLANASASSAALTEAIRVANAASSCPGGARVLRSDGGDARALAAGGTGTYATLASSVGVSGTASSAAAIVAAIAAASFPQTAAAWAAVWGYSAASWAAAFGTSPLGVVAGSIAVVNAASFSPQPAAAASGLDADQQLGLGLGIGLALAAIVAAVGALLYRALAARAKAPARVNP